jgi:hypothetical protein
MPRLARRDPFAVRALVVVLVVAKFCLERGILSSSGSRLTATPCAADSSVHIVSYGMRRCPASPVGSHASDKLPENAGSGALKLPTVLAS